MTIWTWCPVCWVRTNYVLTAETETEKIYTCPDCGRVMVKGKNEILRTTV